MLLEDGENTTKRERQIYKAAGFLIRHANTTKKGWKALRLWNEHRPSHQAQPCKYALGLSAKLIEEGKTGFTIAVKLGDKCLWTHRVATTTEHTPELIASAKLEAIGGATDYGRLPFGRYHD